MKFPKDKFLKFCSRLTIDSKEQGLVRLRLNGAQRFLIDEMCKALENDIHKFVVLKGRQFGACLDPNSKVLTADYRWIRIADCKIGQELVATDEHPSRGPGHDRKMRTAVVTGIHVTELPAYRITFDDGRSVVCSGTHAWMSRKVSTQTSWRAVESGPYNKHKHLKVGTQVRWVTKPWGESSLEDYWFGGMLDGEGSRSQKRDSGCSLSVSQREGAVWERLKAYNESCGYHGYVTKDNKPCRPSKYGKTPVHRLEISRMDELFKVIGQCRPTRFVGWRFWEGKSLPGKSSGIGWATIVSIEKLPTQKLIDITTTTGTFICEGFVTHNSTVMLALDLFWQFYFPGMQGALVSDKEKTRDQFKSTLEGYMLGLPHEWRVPVRQHNRNQLVLTNRSRLAYLVAGGRQSGALARGAGLNFLHATEISSWSDEEGLASLTASLAEKHDNRLYVFESTARGFNIFYDMWMDACRARTTKPIFIGWWLKEDYALDRSSNVFKVYWDGVLDSDERRWVKEVKSLYNYDIKPEQIAWWRWKLNEEIHDEKLMMQEYPPTEEYAFILSGEQFFSTQTLMDIKKEAEKQPEPKSYSYEIGPEFQDTKLHVARDGELTVWQEPDPQGYYTIGADPAYGSSENSDSFVIQVCRCYSDGVEQVAEYASRTGTMYGFAWILAHLAGAYRNVHIVLEITGPGQGVWQELQTLPAKIAFMDAKDSKTGELLNIFGNISHYIYRRPDSMGGGGGFWHWQTTATNKQWVMHGLRDAVERRMFTVHSLDWVDEARYITQEGSHISGAGRSKDDRIMASALAVEGWVRQIQPMLQAQGRTRKVSADRPDPTVGGILVQNYLADIMAGKRPN